MTRAEFNEKSFDEVIEQLIEEGANITTYEDLKEFAKDKIDGEELNVAIHILKAIRDDGADYYTYDYCMGTLETPCGLRDKGNIEHLIDDEEE